MKEKIGTAYDSLQAQTTLAQIQIQLERYRGQVDVAAGNLNSAMGIPANFKLALVDKPMKPALDTATVSVETMIAVARQRRPDLGAAWATAEASEEQVWVAKSAMLPSFSADGSVQHLNVKENAATSPSGWPYSYGVSASLPIFTGLTNWNEVRAAEATAEANRASAVETEQSVISEVWSSYANFKTAGQMVRTSRTWLVAGEKSYKAARISYANGLGNITELLDAQIALSSARSQLVSAETNWFSSLAQLTHDVGWFERGASPNPVFEEGASPSQSPQANLGQ
jgi:outer membrane protein TolC